VPGHRADGRARSAALTALPVSGIDIGHADDPTLRSGVTVILPRQPAVASLHVMGGAPGTRESDLLDPRQTVQHIDGLVLAGGSAYGLDAAGGVQAWLREHGRGFPVRAGAGRPLRVPIVPAAILFDLANGGDKNWGRYPPYRELGYAAAAAARPEIGTGRRGAGFGASTATTPGGFGFASQTLPGGATVLALMAVNAAGSPLIADTDHFWAAPFERNAEFGGRGWPQPMPTAADAVTIKAGHDTAGLATTIGAVITDAALTKLEAKQIAVMAHDGFARALYPVHSPGDGDLLFVLSTGARDEPRAALSLLTLGTVAANVVARAIAQGVYAAMQETEAL